MLRRQHACTRTCCVNCRHRLRDRWVLLAGSSVASGGGVDAAYAGCVTGKLPKRLYVNKYDGCEWDAGRYPIGHGLSSQWTSTYYKISELLAMDFGSNGGLCWTWLPEAGLQPSASSHPSVSNIVLFRDYIWKIEKKNENQQGFELHYGPLELQVVKRLVQKLRLQFCYCGISQMFPVGLAMLKPIPSLL